MFQDIFFYDIMQCIMNNMNILEQNVSDRLNEQEYKRKKLDGFRRKDIDQ